MKTENSSSAILNSAVPAEAQAVPSDGMTTPEPIRPSFSTPPGSGMTLYYHEHDGKVRKKVKIQTPGGTVKTPCRYEIGRSHQVAMDENGIKLYERDFSIVQTPKDRWICLMLALSNLKNRTDQDFNRYEKSLWPPYPPYDYFGHHHYTQVAIENCISKIKACLNEVNNPQKLLDKLNVKIQEGKIYNPFGLRRLYTPNDYNYQSACNPRVYNQNLFMSGFNRVVPHKTAQNPASSNLNNTGWSLLHPDQSRGNTESVPNPSTSVLEKRKFQGAL